jgi:dTDP-4-amino-4,6-dideoxygalactose transaminase
MLNPIPIREFAAAELKLVEPPGPDPIVFGAPAIGEEEIREVVDTLRSGWLGTGPKTRAFEAEFSRYVGTNHAVGTNSGTAALHLALLGLGLGPGDEVITTPLTFVATANVIEHVGATPVFVDVDPADGNISPAAVAAAVTPRTRAILAVHYLGALVDIAGLRRAAPGLPIVLDAAHAVEGSRGDGTSAEGGVCACYSFYVTKNLVTGEGGMLATDDEDLAAFARVASLHGLDSDAYRRYSGSGYRSYEMVMPGFKYNMTDIQASLGLHQLRRLEDMRVTRSRLWSQYLEGLDGIEGVTIPPVALDPEAEAHARHLFTIWIDWEARGLCRESFVQAMHEQGIGTGWHFKAVHQHHYYADRYRLPAGHAPVAEAISDQTVSLPLSAQLDEGSIERIVEAVENALVSGRVESRQLS